MKRNAFLLFLAPALALSTVVGHAGAQAAKDPLLFPKDSFTVETKTVRTSSGEKEVTYRSYLHIPYVAKPVDRDYQSLDVSVPVEVDGVAVDARDAPVLFHVPVGGYMSASHAGRGGPRGGTGGPPAGRMGGPPQGGTPGSRGMGGPGASGNVSRNSRHFTSFSLRHATGNPNATIDRDLQTVVNLMNPMYFIGQNNKGISDHWWIRQGTSDNHNSLTVVGNLAASLENRKKDVNAGLYWDAGHGADEDAEDFIAWVGTITGFTSPRRQKQQEMGRSR